MKVSKIEKLEEMGFSYNPNIIDCNGYRGLIYQKDVYSEDGEPKTNITFYKAKKLAEDGFKNLLKSPRIPTVGEYWQMLLTDKEFQENVDMNIKRRLNEWVDGKVRNGFFYDRSGKIELPDSGYIQELDIVRGAPLKTGSDPNPFLNSALLDIDKKEKRAVFLRSSSHTRYNSDKEVIKWELQATPLCHANSIGFRVCSSL